MGMQKIQNDMIRLYAAAREASGGIDFSLAGRAATTTRSPPHRRPSPPGPEGVATLPCPPPNEVAPPPRRAYALRDEVTRSHRGDVRCTAHHCHGWQRQRPHPRNQRGLDHAEPALQRTADAEHDGPDRPRRQRLRPRRTCPVQRATRPLRHLQSPPRRGSCRPRPRCLRDHPGHERAALSPVTTEAAFLVGPAPSTLHHARQQGTGPAVRQALGDGARCSCRTTASWWLRAACAAPRTRPK